MEDTKYLQDRIAELEAENVGLKLKQIEINQAKELYLKIFEDFPALIWRSGLDKLCNYFNRTWLEFTGRTFEQENGNGWAEGVHPDDFNFCLDTYVTAFDKHEAFYMEYRLMNKAGEYRWLRDFGRPFFDLDNTFLGYIGSCYDITDSKNNEIKLEELNAAKNKFLSILAHDLRSPITNLIGLSNLMLEGISNKDSSEIEPMLKTINLVSIHSLNFLDDLLLWGKSISDGIVLQKQRFLVSEVCNELLVDFEENAHFKGITIEYSEERPSVLFADIHMIKTIIRNLLSNALKFTKRNGTVRILVKETDEWVEITVADNGMGMNQEQLEHVWNFSSQHSTKGTDLEVGTGFGLSICKQLVEKHNGIIWVKSELGKGSEFTFQLPTKELSQQL